MPFPRTWVEELIVEWLHIKGFLVEANFPVTTSRAGGRGEADVIGAKASERGLEILHIETGQLGGGQHSINSVIRKFRDEVVESVTSYFSQRFFHMDSGVDYQKMYVATVWTTPTVQEISSNGISVISLPEFITEMVLPSIQSWKQDPPHSPTIRGGYITLPESFWLLQLLDTLNNNGLLKEPNI